MTILIIQDVARYLTADSSTRSSRATCHSQNSVILPAETAEMRKSLLTLALEKPRKNTKAILKKEKLFSWGDKQYIIHFVNMLKNSDTLGYAIDYI